MLHINTKNPSNTDTTSSSKPLFAFKPRQVLLAEHNRRGNMAACASKEEKSSKITSLTPEIKASLHQSILHYLHRNGFSKTSKRFQSEAEIQSATWKASSLHLEDIFCKYNASNPDTNLNTINKPELGNDEATNEETTTKKKKKKGTIESHNGATEYQSKVTDKKTVESDKNFGQISEDIVVNEPETKPKKKKKTKHDSGSSGQAEEAKPDVNETINGSEIDDLKKKTKEKKKKGIQQDKLESSDTTKNELVTEVADKEKKKKKKPNTDSAVEDDENEGVRPDVTKKEKGSKKRKRSGSDENDNLPTELIINEESKRQKKEQKRKKEGIDAQETSNKEIDGQANGKLEINGGEKSGSQKSMKKQHNGSAEPKTVNAFQRVKIDQVEFAHEKLQDNSYWAKDGAEIGYGAKAQEVLGQVRGRDFRHEKTKKKRGSYRGGLIDLETRSVKFNYSDEE